MSETLNETERDAWFRRMKVAENEADELRAELARVRKLSVEMIEAALTPPVGTCSTCQNWWSKGRECWHPNKPFVALTVSDPATFGCTLHSPLPPAAPGGEG